MRPLTSESGTARPWNGRCAFEDGAQDSCDWLSRTLARRSKANSPACRGQADWLSYYFAGRPVKRIPAVCTL
jgi:hypothetical protein